MRNIEQIVPNGHGEREPSIHPRHGTQGTLIPCSQCHNYKNFMEMVGPEGLEPSTKGGYAITQSNYNDCGLSPTP